MKKLVKFIKKFAHFKETYWFCKLEIISTKNLSETGGAMSGSHDIIPFSMRQQVIDMLHYSHPEDYIRNVHFFETDDAELNKIFQGFTGAELSCG